MNETAESNFPTSLPTNLAPNPPPSIPTNPPPSIPVTADRTPTPGWKTTEFWMTVFGQAGIVLAATSGALPANYAAMAAALSQVAYSLSRGISKANAAR